VDETDRAHAGGNRCIEGEVACYSVGKRVGPLPCGVERSDEHKLLLKAAAGCCISLQPSLPLTLSMPSVLPGSSKPSTLLTVLNHAPSKARRTPPFTTEEPERRTRKETSDEDVPVKRFRNITRLPRLMGRASCDEQSESRKGMGQWVARSEAKRRAGGSDEQKVVSYVGGRYVAVASLQQSFDPVRSHLLFVLLFLSLAPFSFLLCNVVLKVLHCRAHAKFVEKSDNGRLEHGVRRREGCGDEVRRYEVAVGAGVGGEDGGTGGYAVDVTVVGLR